MSSGSLPPGVAALSQHQEVPPGPATVFIGGISTRATEASLKQFLEQFGPVESIRIVIDRMTGKSKGYGFVQFQNKEDAEHLKQQQFVTFSGKAMNVGDSYKGPPLNELKHVTSAPLALPAAAAVSEVPQHKRIHLCIVDSSKNLCDVFRHAFMDARRWAGGFHVTVTQDRLDTIDEFDSVVSGGNSFGLMEGGMEGAIISLFGEDLANRIQRQILVDFDGEQPVGTAFVMQTGHPNHPYVVYAPAMRVPMPICLTDNVYLAMKAALKAVSDHNLRVLENPSYGSLITVLACPALGTSYGKMPYGEAARQMALAVRNWLRLPKYMDWQFAGHRQEQIIWGGTPRSCDIQSVWKLGLRGGSAVLTEHPRLSELLKELRFEKVRWGKCMVERTGDDSWDMIVEATLTCPVNTATLQRQLLQQPHFSSAVLVSLLPS
eukprot:TRINITY_DN18896_c0_g1_i1.p1 TRINITY_DN18896_c0_g1~~TRINITY_DN18896_c0_g1_i1.p1  ORF type:complete len:434 (+),score=67.30 TRINITY_DN18896_c0_g1_i1:95-1396(+)